MECIAASIVERHFLAKNRARDIGSVEFAFPNTVSGGDTSTRNKLLPSKIRQLCDDNDASVLLTRCLVLGHILTSLAGEALVRGGMEWPFPFLE